MNNFFTPIQVIGMVVVAAVLLCSYGVIPYIGAGALIFADNTAFGLRWFGITNPAAAWAVLGATIGGMIALNRSMRRYGMEGRAQHMIIWGAAGFGCLFLMSFLFCHTMKPTIPVRRAPTPAVQYIAQ